MMVFFYFAIFILGAWANRLPPVDSDNFFPQSSNATLEEEEFRLLHREERGDSYDAYRAGLVTAACRALSYSGNFSKSGKIRDNHVLG